MIARRIIGFCHELRSKPSDGDIVGACVSSWLRARAVGTPRPTVGGDFRSDDRDCSITKDHRAVLKKDRGATLKEVGAGEKNRVYQASSSMMGRRLTCFEGP